MESYLVSVIIPTYNRSHLIGETLDSIMLQTYDNWECIIVDDGSIDYTAELLGFYIQIDDRFKFFKRTKNYLSGGNGARNYGLNLAKGDYIIFFDSDDLMTKDHIEVKFNAIVNHKVDYVITRTKFLNSTDKSMDRYYKFDQYKVNPNNYILQKINWLTYDTLVKASLAKSILFNERLHTGQEYNYYSKLISKSTRCTFIDKVVTLRRKHAKSKQGKLKLEEDKIKSSIPSIWETFLELNPLLSEKTRKHLLFKILDANYHSKETIIPNLDKFKKKLAIEFPGSVILFSLMMFSKRNFNKGYFLRNLFKRKLLNH
ncbi:glycosyltransferase family 2 protein [Zunongwangia profunda]|nr:glycosyltransferase family 2 protein [Zunongwangia profunda]